MRSMPPLVVTATANISWLNPKIAYPNDPASRAKAAAACEAAGAAIFHMHAEDSWRESIEAVRSSSDLVVQCGMSSLPIPERMEVYESSADMISIIVSHHDEAFAEVETNVLHGRDELERYAGLCREHGVKPELEIWHSGSIWNLRYLIDRGLLDAPYVTTLFFGWPGGTWSPPTIEEYLYRRRQLPEDCVATVSIMGEGQLPIIAAAMAQGDHVRVGTEDNPFSRDGSVASTERLVEEVVEIARAMGRPVASPQEARSMLGIRTRGGATR
jgi:3-keto-5-aminohexanoate cleavage enzyme